MGKQDVGLQESELELLLHDLNNHHGYDFRNYSRASLLRQTNRLYQKDRFPSFAEMRYRLINDTDYVRHFIEEITVNVTEMFRDPEYFRFLSEELFPVLATYPFIRIWVAGCSTGEEAFSIAILLKEAGLLDKSIIYATDLNAGVLERAQSGKINLRNMQQNSENYLLAGGKNDFSTYYTANYHYAQLSNELRNRIIFSVHNLVSDNSFNEFQLICCRNVLIYFDNLLQNRVFKLFDASLGRLGYLLLGSKETLHFSDISAGYKVIDPKLKIWRKQSS